ncbi:alpha/beta hydrolase [Streptomyces sp. col6]|uniref:alpha/beta fold hydrolase n=1 Tax=Streptomyces sp. col6 TaxID=2478958 RepID=UPI0011CD7322|nr:alpha/beta hydrolase [Streptomyces sp. col6]TXS04443.1 alpha/beta hydrolase [Streptomyces sp. col6]
MPWTEHTVVRDGVRLVCRDRGGPGRPLVLLHGLAGHSGEWEGLAERLAPHYRVVAVDQRGHGASERRPDDVSRAAYVADVVAVVDRLGLDRPVLAGQSLGGHTALLTAAAHPDLPAALVLVEAGSGGPSPGLDEHIGGWLDSWPVPFPSREAAAAFFGGGPAGAGWAAGLDECDDGWRPRFDRDVMVGSITENARRSFHEEWDRVTCPTLLVLGRKSFIPAEEVDEMLRRRPATQAVSIPDTGHDLHLERPEALYGALSAFLDGLG